MKVSAKDLQRIIREEIQIIEMWPWSKKPVVDKADDSFNTDPAKHYPRSEVDPNKEYPSFGHLGGDKDREGHEIGNKQALSYMNGLGVMTLRHFKDDIEKWMANPRDTGAMLPGDPRLNAIIYMGKLDPKKRMDLYNTAVAAAEAEEEEEMIRRGRDPRTGALVIHEGVDLWNRIIGPRGDAYSGTGYTLKEGPGSDDYTDPSDIVSRGWRERADEKSRQDAANYEKHKASLGSGKELPDPLASSYEEAEEDETYGLYRGYGSRRPR